MGEARFTYAEAPHSTVVTSRRRHHLGFVCFVGDLRSMYGSPVPLQEKPSTDHAWHDAKSTELDNSGTGLQLSLEMVGRDVGGVPRSTV